MKELSLKTTNDPISISRTSWFYITKKYIDVITQVYDQKTGDYIQTIEVKLPIDKLAPFLKEGSK